MSKPTSLRIPDKLFCALNAECRRRAVPFPDFTRFVEMNTASGLRTGHIAALYETRNLLRRRVAARSEEDALEARAEAEREAREERP